MSVAHRINSHLRKKLHEPFGVLIKGSLTENKEKLDEIIRKYQPSILISVGDMVSRDLSDHNYNPKIIIIDNRCMRKKITPRKFPVSKVVHVRNPPGTITEESIKAIIDALETDNRTEIVVDGEEDLLSLIAVLQAPKKALVIYGQPKEGLVVIKVTENKKTEVKKILKDMKPLRKTK
jgi:uncharacterized protein (UPF0218 family)